MAFKNASLSIWAISNEILNSEYLKLLEEHLHSALILQKDTFAVILEAVSLCLKLTERKDEK